MRRLLSVILLTNYLLAVTVSALFHDHGERPCAADHVCRGAHGHHGEKHEHSAPEGDEPCPAGDGQDKDCRVCRFLSQQPIPVEPISETQVEALLVRLAVVRPIRAAAAVPSTRHIRGPPCACMSNFSAG